MIPPHQAAVPRVGFGFDSHRFDPGRPMVLGGVKVAGEPGFAGHSDGDVLLHAAIDAILSGAGLGDIGARFPDDDPKWKDADSAELLADAARAVRKAGFRIAFLDLTYVADVPKIAPLREKIAARVREALGPAADESFAVAVKGKTSEGLTGLGRGEGAVAFATATLVR